jgi:hypothetical protein
MPDEGLDQPADGGGVERKTAPGFLSQPESPAISAVAVDGVEILVDELNSDGSYRFGNLRPGKWRP